MSVTQMNAVQDELLTDVSQAYIPEGMIADLILPEVPSKFTTGKLGKYGKAHLRIESSLVGGKGAYRRVDSIVKSTSSYDIESHGLEGLVTERDYRNSQKPFDAEQDEVLGLTTLIALRKEYDMAAALTSASILTQNTTLVGAAQFNNYGSSDPLGVFQVARKAVRDGCGMKADLAIMDYDTAQYLAYHPAILDALGFTQNRAGQLSELELAKAMGVQRLLIAEGKYNSAKEGQTDALASIWGKDIIFAKSPTKATKYQTALGYKVVLSGQSQRRVFKYDVKNPPNSTGILVDDSYDFLLSDVTAAYLIKAAIA